METLAYDLAWSISTPHYPLKDRGYDVRRERRLSTNPCVQKLSAEMLRHDEGNETISTFKRADVG